MEHENKGITLVALVITIIVLLILAGVTINLTLGENGIFKVAEQAARNYKDAENKEQQILNEAEVSLEQIVGYAKYDEPYIPEGFKYKEGTWNNGYTIIGDTVSTGNEFVWVPCVLNQTKVKPQDKVVTFGRILPKTSDETDVNYRYNQAKFTITGEENSANEIKDSVRKYGGFYIAKYEAGIEGEKDNYTLYEEGNVTSVAGDVKPLSQAGKGSWNYISKKDAMTVSKAMLENEDTDVKSVLISGEAWDTTLQWIVNTSENSNNEPNVKYDINSHQKGWYSDVSNNTIHTTGYKAVNNIYDMAGNAWELTTENCIWNKASYSVYRGGGHQFLGTSHPAACRYGTQGQIGSIGFRVVIYK